MIFVCVGKRVLNFTLSQATTAINDIKKLCCTPLGKRGHRYFPLSGDGFEVTIQIMNNFQ
jgi:hypothetical protein